MTARIVGAKLTRRIADSTGLDVVRAWGSGGHDFEFATADHRHGLWSARDEAWQWDERPIHKTSCRELFGWRP